MFNTILLDGIPEELGTAIGLVFFAVVILTLLLLIHFFLKNKNRKP
ncbi:MAG: hypothetical protein QM738_18045 [Ferruginibacter sp.]